MSSELNLQDIFKDIPVLHISITVAAFIVAFMLSKLAKRGLRKIFAKKREEEKSFWAQFWKAESRFIIKAVSWIVWLSFIGIALYIWSVHIGMLFARIVHLYPPLLKSIFIIILAMVALKAINQLVRFVVEQLTPLAERSTSRGKQRVATLNHTFRYGATIVIIIVATLMTLGTFGIDLKAILATVGIASLAIGFGAQSLVKDMVSGIFILIEDQFAVGDMVMIGDQGGIVERITLRITQMRNTEGTLITIPNGSIEMVKNLTSEWSRVDYRIGVAYQTDLDRAMDIVMDEARRLRADMSDLIIDDPELMGVDEFEDSSITLRVWIKTLPLKQWVVKRELNRRIHKRFEKDGIEIPFPQRTLWMKESREST